MQSMNRYAYSFDRETFRGEYPTREAAAAAGFEAATRFDGAVEAVYVGKRVAVNPQAEGHADDVARAMRRRMLERTGEANFLVGANEHLMADLDACLERVIVDWLKRNKLEPQARPSAISEHPLPTVATAAGNQSRDEVRLLGPEE